MNKKTNIYIDPACDVHYSSFYIYGLYGVFGRKNVSFSPKYFKNFKHNIRFFAFVIVTPQETRKYVIDFTDSSTIDPIALEWCNVYGKVNLDSSQITSKKVIAIGPSFGIQIYNFTETLWYAITNFLKSYQRLPNKRRFFSNYKSQYNRPKFSEYQSTSSRNHYIFFMASLWKQETLTNTFRANFIKSCMINSNISFEGGFAPRTKNDILGYEDLTTKFRISMTDYLHKTKASTVVFNTPAVKGCHGWKLAEYLCLGKAIISTPITRALPEPLIDGETLIYTDGTAEDITEKVNSIILNPSLKRQLEINSKHYFESHLMPKLVIERLHAH